MIEIWKDIKGYEGLYQISDIGRVKSFHKNKESILKNHELISGYENILLQNKGNKKWASIHRLVAKHFLSKEENKNTVNHKNGARNDNRVENLEWCTQSENILHSFKRLSRKSINYGKIESKNHLAKSILQVSQDGFIINEFGSIKEASRITGIHKSSISDCKRGIYKTAGRYIWI